jgi:beta-galactosidase
LKCLKICNYKLKLTKTKSAINTTAITTAVTTRFEEELFVVTEAGTCLQPVKVYSNQKTVELLLNGKSLGVQKVVDNIALFEVPFVNGENRLDALTAEDPALRDQLKVDFRAIPSNLKDTKTPFTEINVMLGSKRYFEDKTNAVVWIPEQEYTVGSWGTVGGKSYTKKTNRGELVTSDLDILGSNIDPVYQTARMGLEAFKMDVPEGKYTVCLYWAELQTDKEQKASVYNLGNDALKEDFVKRIFDVEINGKKVLDHLDLVREFGEQTAGVKKFEVDVDKNEGLSIDFKKINGETMLNAIRVYRNY